MSGRDGDDRAAGIDIDGYEIVGRLGHGGFSTVFRARQDLYDRTVAVKVLDVSVDDERLRKRFRREISATGRLTGHPNVVTVLDSGFTHDERPYLTMPLYATGSLRDRMERDGPLPVDDVLRFGIKIASALHAAHEAGVVHRDVKPENILMSDYGEPALADFGIASVVSLESSHTETTSYTPTHAAPEILSGAPATVASDIYGLGSTIYALLAGRPAFEPTTGSGLAGFVTAVLASPVPPLARTDVPASLLTTIAVAMAKDPRDRIASAREFAHELQDVQRELGLPITQWDAGTDRRAEMRGELRDRRSEPLPSTERSGGDETIAPPPPPSVGTDRQEFRVEGHLTVIGGRAGRDGVRPPIRIQDSPAAARSRRRRWIVWLSVAAGVVVLGAVVASAWLFAPLLLAAGEGTRNPAESSGDWRTVSITGTVPAGSQTADVGLRVNLECECSGPASFEVDAFTYSEGGGGNLVPNGSFDDGNEPWGWDGSATADLIDSDGLSVFAVDAAPDESLFLNSGTFPVTDGAPFEVTVTLRDTGEIGDAGYFDVIFLGPDGEVERATAPIGSDG